MSAGTVDLSEFHGELGQVARDLLASGEPGERVDWQLIAGAGWLGLEAPARLDGADATFAEVAVILREMGRAAAAGPYLGVAGMSVGALALLAPSDTRDALFRDTAAGSTVPVLALDGQGRAAESFRLERRGGSLRLYGSASFVLDAPTADRLLVPALDPGGSAVVVDVDPAALAGTAQPVVDTTRSFGTVVAQDVAVHDEQVWSFGIDPRRASELLDARAAVAVACDSLGMSEAMMDTTVRYAGVREQFGRKIGSFQAVKHACADMLVQVTIARKLVVSAADKVSEAAPDAPVAAAMAKSYAGAAAVDIVGKAMQLHGGIGYTWESGVHRYLKRATLNRSLHGSPTACRRLLAQRYREWPE
jgi:alkylation response protein AidB-like acyl-CoA dehydrogenase